MYEKLLEQPKKHLELITQLEKYFQIENVDDVVELYEKNNEAFDGLPLYHEKIQEIYGDTPVKLTISHDPLMPEADIVLHIEKKSATLKEWSEKNLQLVQWTTRNETWQKRDKKNHVIAMNDIEGDCTEEFFKEFGCGV